MAQTGYTPLLIYSSSTVSQAPSAGNLTNSTLGSELAINITDGKLFYKDNANAVQVIAWKTTPTTAGGTGLTSYTAGDLLYYASGTTLSKLAIGASTTILTSSGTAPQWSAASGITVGTATNLAGGAAGSLPYQSGAGATTFVSIGSAYQALQVNAGGTAPSWQASATSTLTAQGDLLYASAANTLARLAKNTTATRYLSNTGSSNNPAWAQVDLSNGVTGTLPVGNGGTGQTSWTSNGVLYASATSTLATTSTFAFDGNNLGLGVAANASTRFSLYKADNTVYTSGARGNVWQQVYNTSTTSGAYAGIEIGVDGVGNGSLATIATIDAGSGTAEFAISTRISNTFADRLRIDSSSNTTFSGSVSAITTGQVINTVKSSSTSGTRDAILRLSVASNGGNDPAGTVLFTYDTAYTQAAKIDSILTAGGGAGILRFFTSTSEAFRLNDTQQMLVGYTASNGAYKLQVNSQIFATNATIATSDGNYKTNVTPLNDALSLVCKLKPVSFKWKQHPVHNFDCETPTIGFIAQEVKETLKLTGYVDSIVKRNECVIEPEVVENGVIVKEAIKEEFLGLADATLVALLTKAIQELKAEFDAYRSTHP